MYVPGLDSHASRAAELFSMFPAWLCAKHIPYC